MAKRSFPFRTSPSYEDHWKLMAKWWRGTGVLPDYLNELAVFADGLGMNVKVPSGGHWTEGFYFDSDAQETLAIAASDPTNPRIDRVVVKLDITTPGSPTHDLLVKTGTPAGSPAAPALTTTATVWEVSLAQVLVDAAVGVVVANKVTDERTFSAFAIEDGVITVAKLADETAWHRDWLGI